MYPHTRIIRVKYEDGVLKPLEPVDLEEGEEVVVEIKRSRGEEVEELLNKYTGVLGKASYRELLELEIEANEQQ